MRCVREAGSVQGAHVVATLCRAGMWDVSSGIRKHAGGDELELGGLGELARVRLLCEAPSFINLNLTSSRVWCAGGPVSTHEVCGASGCKFGGLLFRVAGACLP